MAMRPYPIRGLHKFEVPAGAETTGFPAWQLTNSEQLHFGEMLAICCHGCHNDGMAVQITIRGVPEDVRDELAARAALRGQSMQEYLRGELERLAAKPSVELWLERVQERKAAYRTRVTAAEILEERDQDRK